MKTRKTVLAGIIAAAVITATVGTTALAADTGAAGSDSTTKGNHVKFEELTDEQKAALKAEMDSKFKAVLDELVTDGSITQAQADEAYSVITASDGKVDFSKLPQAVQTALKDKMPQMVKRCGQRPELTDEQIAQMKKDQIEKLAQLVKAGTITQAQADELASLINESDGMVDISKLTDEQKEILKKLMPEKCGQPIEGLSAEVSKEIREAIDKAVTEAINALVSDGTITEEQAQQMNSRKPDGSQQSTLTDEQKEAIKTAAEKARTEVLNQYVSNGTITQEIADKLAAAPGRFGGHRGPGGPAGDASQDTTTSVSQS